MERVEVKLWSVIILGGRYLRSKFSSRWKHLQVEANPLESKKYGSRDLGKLSCGVWAKVRDPRGRSIYHTVKYLTIAKVRKISHMWFENCFFAVSC